MRKMKDSGVEWLGEVPAEWGFDRLGGFFSLRSEKVSDEDYTPLSVTKGGVVPQLSHVAKSDDHANRKLVRKGDFAINSRSDRRNSCGFASQDGSVSLINTICVPRGEIESRYFGYLFDSSQWSDEFYSWGHGIVADLWTTGWNDMKKILLPVPPLDEQRRIADYLDEKCAEIDRAVSAAEQSIEEYKAYRRSAVSGCIEKADGSKVRFKNIARVVPNLVSPEDYQDLTEIDPENIEKDTGRLINLRSVYEVGAISDKHHFAKGQILYSKIRPLLNKVTIAPCEGLCSADMYPIETSEDVNWLRYAMTSESFSRQVSLACARVKMPKINVAQLGLIYLNVPFNAEQRRIVDYLDEKCAQIDAVIATKRAIVADLKAYKQSLIYETVTGKREV